LEEWKDGASIRGKQYQARDNLTDPGLYHSEFVEGMEIVGTAMETGQEEKGSQSREMTLLACHPLFEMV
jgi:hypothetical protein